MLIENCHCHLHPWTAWISHTRRNLSYVPLTGQDRIGGPLQRIHNDAALDLDAPRFPAV